MVFQLTPLDFSCASGRKLAEAARRSAGEWVLPALSRFERLFVLRSPFAQGLAFVGAQGSTPLLGCPVPSSIRLNAGGTGLSLSEALISCLGEGLEFLSQVERDGDVTEVGNLAAVRGRLALEVGAWLSASYSHVSSLADRPLDWRTAINAETGQQTLVPADLCLRRSEHRRQLPLLGPLSTGCAVGKLIEDAASRAILELVERDAVALWWLGGRLGRPLSSEGSIALQVASLLTQLRLGSIRRRTWLLDITTDLGVPVFAALSADENGRGLACGFASRLVASDAAQAAILEMCQVETAFALVEEKLRECGPAGLGQMDRRHLRRGTLDVDACALVHPTGTPAVWSEEAFSRAAGLAELIRRLKDHGIDLWLSDLTRSDFDVIAAHAFAPKLQPFPSTYRSRRLLSVVEQFGGCPPDAAGIEIM